MTVTLEPMLAFLGLGKAEIVLILIALMFPVMTAALVISIVLFVQKNKQGGKSTNHPAVAPAIPKRGLWVVLGILVVGGAMALLNTARHNQIPTGELLRPIEFDQLVNSNRIIEAKFSHDSGSPLFKVTGTYEKIDGMENKTVALFTVPKMTLTDAQLERRLESLPKSEVQELNPTFSLFSLILPPILLFLVLVSFVGIIIFIIVRLASRNRTASRIMVP